jgi:iron complex transport system substrate-binding protein
MRQLGSIHLIAFFLLLTACSPVSERSGKNTPLEETRPLSYAERFSIDEFSTYRRITVYSPWQKAGNVRFDYVLADSLALIPDSLSHAVRIRTPLERVVILSTVHAGYLEALGCSEAIVGMSGTRHLYSDRLVQRVKSSAVREVGSDRNLNFEMTIDLDPDAIFLYGVDAGVSRLVKRLEVTGIPVIICADYLEQHPLGRAEWIKFFGAFFNRTDDAGIHYQSVEHAYDSIRQLASQRETRPVAFLGLPWKDAWYIAGGTSFAAKLLQDAGATYAWTDLDTEEAIPMDLETVYTRILGADYWINPGIAGSLQNLISHDNRFGQLPAVRKGLVYNNNRRIGPGGGNDYWESGVIHPHLVLRDLYRIFHGSESEKDSLYYYRHLQ